MMTRIAKRLKASHRVRLTIRGHSGQDEVRGGALLTNLSSHGLCLTRVRWNRAAGLAGPNGSFDVHLPLLDRVGVDLTVRPVRVRFSNDALEIGAAIVQKPERFREALEALGTATEPVKA